MSDTPTPPPPAPPAPPAPLATPAPSALPALPGSSDDDPRPPPRIDTSVIGDDTDPDYKPPEKKTVEELLGAKEGEDEALQRYKQQLLGVAAAGGGKTDDPRRVVITKLELLINGREPLSFDMTQESNLNGKLTVQIKEGCEYKTQLTFRVQNELISGLKYKNTVAGASSGIVLLRVNEMLGSYGPDPQKTNVFVFPRREWEEGTRPTLEAARTPCRSALPTRSQVIS